MNSAAVVSRLSSSSALVSRHAQTAATATVPAKLSAAELQLPKGCSNERWMLPANLHHSLLAPRISAEAVVSGDEQEDAEDDEERSSQSDGDESCCTASDCSSEEIPVWIKGEQRFISGVTEETTCADLIEALIQQDGVALATADPKDYCITERWRQVEQILDGKTKIWQIWSAWGKEQPEVKFILRRAEGSHGLALASTSTAKSIGGACGGALGLGGTERDKDSGRGSPTGSINSAIVRRKRHRAHKSSFAWMTHGTTIHPKSSKNSIERLMTLILEQGDIIQQQLSKLRDRELQISKIEEDRHRVRERAHGKNYLLETYLKGLSEATEVADGNVADSGITSEATTAASPEVESCRDADSPAASVEKNTGLKDQIRMLEKIVQLNKQIVKEEEMAVKLYDRIRRHQMDIPNQTPEQVEENLSKVNASIEKNQSELKMIDESLKQSEQVLREKNLLLQSLQEQLDEGDVQLQQQQPPQADVIMDFSAPNPVLSISRGSPAAVVEPVGIGLPKQTSADDSYPKYTNSDKPELGQNASTLPRNQRFPVTPQSAIPSISVHQINKFIQSNSRLGNNCNTMLDDKICPKQLFNSVLGTQLSPPPAMSPGLDTLNRPPDDDLSNLGTLV
ncbi:ras association domain-containing protein 9 [Sabethes cyaneus]|uniref:ras association domain-containing protein 9 n=1 Tax=Sabethes cyaneus TaxID=53552 RepID=UPI00237D52FF|nr:ras association domain-containing protein 9 [Sabethes cyaneus]